MDRRNFFRLVAGVAAIAVTGPAALLVPPKRRLKAVWSFEAAEDLRSQHNIAAEKELTEMLACEINQEIDREITHGLRRRVVNGVGWSKSAGRFVI